MKPFAFSFKSEAIWMIAFSLVPVALGLLIVLVVFIIRSLR